MSKLGLRIPVLAWAVLAILLSAVVYAQETTGSISGTITDSSGASVKGATVTLTNTATGIQQTKQTDSEGKYEFPSVQIGSYQVVAEAQGFDRARTETFQVLTNARQRVDVTLKTGSVSNEVTVTSAAELLDTETSSHSTVIGTRQALFTCDASRSSLASPCVRWRKLPIAAGRPSR